MYTLNSIGDKMPSCLTPLVTRKGVIVVVTLCISYAFSDGYTKRLKFNYRITELQKNHIIDSLKPKTSTGVDSISNQLLKFVKCGIAKPLTIIIKC